MQKFSDYIKNNESKDDNKISNKVNKEISKDDLQSKIDEYSGYSSDKLLNEFMRLTIEKKRNGELSENELEKLKTTISPMLTSQQKQTLEGLLQVVKNVK